MKDLKNIALEKASTGRSQPVGSSFESQHKREKEALVRQIDSLDGSRIQKIEANSGNGRGQKILRVAAYCRVSTDDIDQAISITMQRKNYSEMIKANPAWKYVGSYVDDGFSGTNTDHRMGFQQMMADAMAGKIDMIITKSVSRFSRNIADCILWIDKLKVNNVSVFFQQENFDTMNQTSSIILYVLAMVAEEESHMKSEAMLLSLEWRFSRGRFLTPRLFGYDVVKIPDGLGGEKKVLIINEAEARVVRWIYYNILNGADVREIAEVLTELEIPTGGRRRDGTLNTIWTPSGTVNLVRNERYCGDVLSRKTWTPNFKDHKSKKNNGAKNKYFLANHHDAIVSRKVWNTVQKILNSRKYGHEGSYLPMRIIDRGTLTGYISLNLKWAGYEAEDYIKASQIAMGVIEGELTEDLENEYLPEKGMRVGRMIDDHGISKIERELTEAEKKIKAELEGWSVDEQDFEDKEKLIQTFQVVKGEFFSSIYEPVVRISKNGISFNSRCRAKLSNEYVEILFNPVERMIIVRPSDENNPNAVPWSKDFFNAGSMSRIICGCMGWDRDYTYRIMCQEIHEEDGPGVVLAFDLDNFIGRARKVKDEIIMPAKLESTDEEKEGTSYFFPPEEDSEPMEIKDIEERFTKKKEQESKIFGEPYFVHNEELRSFVTKKEGGIWDMMIEARPVDAVHMIDEETVETLFQEITENPPRLPDDKDSNDPIIDGNAAKVADT